MKLLFPFLLLFQFTYTGDVSSQIMMELDGAIKIGDTNNTRPELGTVRYNPDKQDFEGWNGEWVSLTYAPVATGSGSVKDVDGNTYLTVQIGTQTWMRENLRTTRYRNGDPILEVLLDSDWADNDMGAWCWYDHDPEKEIPYGKLYNWYAMNDERELCPTGWHVPTYEEWTTMLDHLGGASVAGGKMKKTGTVEAGTGYWLDPNAGATNESGFAAVAAGYRFEAGAFADWNSQSYFWSSSVDDDDNLLYLFLSHSNDNMSASAAGENRKALGFSVRCVKD